MGNSCCISTSNKKNNMNICRNIEFDKKYQIECNISSPLKKKDEKKNSFAEKNKLNAQERDSQCLSTMDSSKTNKNNKQNEINNNRYKQNMSTGPHQNKQFQLFEIEKSFELQGDTYIPDDNSNQLNNSGSCYRQPYLDYDYFVCRSSSPCINFNECTNKKIHQKFQKQQQINNKIFKKQQNSNNNNLQNNKLIDQQQQPQLSILQNGSSQNDLIKENSSFLIQKLNSPSNISPNNKSEKNYNFNSNQCVISSQISYDQRNITIYSTENYEFQQPSQLQVNSQNTISINSNNNNSIGINILSQKANQINNNNNNNNSFSNNENQQQDLKKQQKAYINQKQQGKSLDIYYHHPNHKPKKSSGMKQYKKLRQQQQQTTDDNNSIIRNKYLSTNSNNNNNQSQQNYLQIDQNLLINQSQNPHFSQKIKKNMYQRNSTAMHTNNSFTHYSNINGENVSSSEDQYQTSSQNNSNNKLKQLVYCPSFQQQESSSKPGIVNKLSSNFQNLKSFECRPSQVSGSLTSSDSDYLYEKNNKSEGGFDINPFESAQQISNFNQNINNINNVQI